MAEVVWTEDLAAVIESYLESVVANGDAEPMRTLCERAEIDDRFFRRLLKRTSKYTNLPLADRLLLAMGRQYALVNGEVPVIPNPKWTLEKYRAYMEERGCM